MATVRELLADRLTKDDQIIGAKIGDRIVDLHSPVADADTSKLAPIRASDPDGLKIIRHSTAHVMADAVQRLYPGTKVTIGPATQNGFYYDFDRQDGAFTEEDLAKIEQQMLQIVEGNHPFRREVVSRAAAHELFAGMGETYKRELIDAIPEGEEISLYRHGASGSEWVDLCEGPHVPHTGFLKAVKLTSVAGAYWRGDERNPMLQRIYGTAFATPKELRTHLTQLEEAKKRDHRKLGKELGLFLFHEWAPAMPFYLPRGAYIYSRLQSYMRGLYERYGYEEVITPQIFDRKLFDTSGHLPNYRPNMYLPVTADDLDELAAAIKKGATLAEVLPRVERLGMKPMNCPSHCLIFKSTRRSYRELPWRMADFGRLHRYERGGVVHGLARVRSFAQDDAHIFCTPAQAGDEIKSFIRLAFEVYHAIAFKKVDLKLATRPEKRIGTDAQWDDAERQLAEALTETGYAFEVLPGEGAFYGPKIEFHVEDAIGRSWQLGTIQFDYGLPDRFDLTYTDSDGAAKRPVMLHRALLGSLERFMALFIEHTGGAFPPWIAPEQATVVSVSEKHTAYGEQVVAFLRERGFRVNEDLGAEKLGAKIRNARLMRVPYILVVGDKEAEQRTVSPRSRDLDKNLEPMSLDDFAARLQAEAMEPRLQATKAGAAAPAIGVS
jgi:threonyl-tRNA synthetase